MPQNIPPTRKILRAAAIAVCAVMLAGPALAVSSDSNNVPAIAEVKTEIKAGNFRRAISMLTDILEADSRNADALNLMGYAQRKSGNVRRGEAFYLQALRIKPNHLGANEYLGELYVESGRIDKAEERLQVLKDACGNCAEYSDLAKVIAAAR